MVPEKLTDTKNRKQLQSHQSELKTDGFLSPEMKYKSGSNCIEIISEMIDKKPEKKSSDEQRPGTM